MAWTIISMFLVLMQHGLFLYDTAIKDKADINWEIAKVNKYKWLQFYNLIGMYYIDFSLSGII